MLGSISSSRCQTTRAPLGMTREAGAKSISLRTKPCAQVPNGAPNRTRCAIDASHRREPPGGARRDRTDDLLLAKQALSQLSYGPRRWRPDEMVGLDRLERSTSPLSGVRSNHLSYRPQAHARNPRPRRRERRLDALRPAKSRKPRSVLVREERET
jgi:hypothetical protein